MSFRDYAFTDVLKILDDGPSHQLGMLVGITKKEIRGLPKKLEPKKHPSYGLDAIASLSKDEMLKRAPELSGAMAKGKMKHQGGGAVLSSNILLPALFATVAEHICNRGGQVEFFLEASSGVKTKATFDANFFEQYRDNINGGTKAMFEKILQESDNARDMKMYLFFKPLTLN